MKFEHLIQINDPLNPLIDALSRDQLWRGLMAYVEDPASFQVGLDRCAIIERGVDRCRRELFFGRVRVQDQVQFFPQERIRIDTLATAETPAGALTLTIEQPGPEQLYLRFIFETFPQGHGVVPAEYQAVMKEAYRQTGIDIVRRIRDLAAGADEEPHSLKH
jgi:hypothetical protein